jgi:hypothetical protein
MSSALVRFISKSDQKKFLHTLTSRFLNHIPQTSIRVSRRSELLEWETTEKDTTVRAELGIISQSTNQSLLQWCSLLILLLLTCPSGFCATNCERPSSKRSGCWVTHWSFKRFSASDLSH